MQLKCWLHWCVKGKWSKRVRMEETGESVEAVHWLRKGKREKEKEKVWHKKDFKMGNKSEQEREKEFSRRIQAWGSEGGRQEDRRECGWEREGMRRDTKRQTEGKREWSILEPWVTHGDHKASTERLATGSTLLYISLICHLLSIKCLILHVLTAPMNFV